MSLVILIVAVTWLAYANGANDNFKGVATLYGSGATTYRSALTWATVATAAGALVSVVFAASLAAKFTGKGLVALELVGTFPLQISVSVAAAATVILATWLGLPTSTTHALTGALLGAAVAHGGAIKLAGLWASFFRPLLISPIFAVVGAALLYVSLRRIRRATNVTAETCVCVGEPAAQSVAACGSGTAVVALKNTSALEVAVADRDDCDEYFDDKAQSVGASGLVDRVHFGSGAAVCFGRAVNDTPKIAALLLIVGAGHTIGVLVLVAGAMLIGGLLQSRKVAETMSRRITTLNTGQGLTANLTTAALVLGASRLGLPVSTTHVSCGSIFGIGLVNGKRDWKTISHIAGAWVITLPLAALLSAVVYWFVA